MKIYRTERDLQRAELPPAAVTIGTFDGLHLGHQGLFRELLRRSDELLLNRRVVLSFYPHPRAVLARLSRSARQTDPRFLNISSLRTELRLLPEFGLTEIALRRFTPSFSELSAEEFLEQILLRALRAKLVVVGHDWSFGRGREGTVDTLQEFCARNDIAVSVVGPVAGSDFGRVSSSEIRLRLQRGAVHELPPLLGRPFSVTGRVIRGDGRGRGLGFPTANLHLPEQLLPADGVYAVQASLDDQSVLGAANIGLRPTFAGSARRLEVHLLDLPFREFYGARLSVAFLHRIRGELKFSGVEELRGQISRDIQAVRGICP